MAIQTGWKAPDPWKPPEPWKPPPAYQQPTSSTLCARSIGTLAPTKVVVQQNQSLSSIAAANNIPQSSMVAANRGMTRISPGMTVKVPSTAGLTGDRSSSFVPSAASVTGDRGNIYRPSYPGGGRSENQYVYGQRPSMKPYPGLSTTNPLPNNPYIYNPLGYIGTRGAPTEGYLGSTVSQRLVDEEVARTSPAVRGSEADYNRYSQEGRNRGTNASYDDISGHGAGILEGGRGIQNLDEHLFGSPIYEYDEKGNVTGQKTDEMGNPIYSRGVWETGQNLPPALGYDDIQQLAYKYATQATEDDPNGKALHPDDATLQSFLKTILDRYDPPLFPGAPYRLKVDWGGQPPELDEETGGGSGGGGGGGYGSYDYGGFPRVSSTGRSGAGTNVSTNMLTWRIATG